MAADVFSRTTQVLADVIPVDSATLQFAAGDGGSFGVGMMTQNAQINYQQTINRLFEVGTNNQYYVGGRTQGQMSLGRVIGSRAVQVAFYAKYGDMCKARSNNINITAGGGCPGTDGVSAPNETTKVAIQYCVITSVGFTVAAQDMMINENVQLMFVSLSVTSS